MLRKILSFFGTRVGLAILLALLVIGIAAFVKTNTSDLSQKKSPTALAVEKIIKKSLEDDTDGDTLKNWEEALYKTDPENPDTDKDGMNDGAEIASNRDPLIVGTGKGAPDLATTTDTEFNATDRFSQELFVRYINAKKSGQEITADLSEKIAEEVLSKDYTNANVPLISENDIITISTNQKNLFTYANSVGKITTTKLPTGTQDELTTLAGVANDPSLAESADFTPNIDRYGKMIANLKSLSVPEGTLSAHVKLVNGLITIFYAVEGMTMLNSDPIGALSRIPLHQDGVELLQAGALELRGVLTRNNVVFSPNDYGYRLVAE